LHSAKDAHTVVRAKDGEEVQEEGLGPAEFGEDEDDALTDDEQTVEDREHDTSRLDGDRRGLEIIALEVKLVAGCVGESAGGDLGAAANCVYVTETQRSAIEARRWCDYSLDHHYNTGCEHEDEGEDGERADGIEPKEGIGVESDGEHDCRICVV
jgi:hypothetical protein